MFRLMIFASAWVWVSGRVCYTKFYDPPKSCLVDDAHAQCNNACTNEGLGGGKCGSVGRNTICSCNDCSGIGLPPTTSAGAQTTHVPTTPVPNKHVWTDEDRLWAGGVVPFAFSQGFTYEDKARQLILKAMAGFENATCIRFVHRTTEPDYVTIIRASIGCSSYIGKQRGGSQFLSLNMPHAFSIYPETASFGEPYDFDSIMHAGMFEHAIDGNIWAIKPKEKYKDKVIGQRIQLSAIDIRKINKMFKCPPGHA
ncbi:hypothetical protein BV898_15145 [Hypsibius exemplaris]|uniref:Peptidase M12A domain-containing protein n=1 Tax=Hypsibius exemplaris TaxID=2072580 RepID=A0A9X6NAX3_HYPEX|nr:hypothetical protein BV898_15145 [Hypsibius exemplaris]